MGISARVLSGNDFLQFVAQFGLSQGDEQYNAKYNLDSDGTICVGDLLIFVNALGKAGSELVLFDV